MAQWFSSRSKRKKQQELADTVHVISREVNGDGNGTPRLREELRQLMNAQQEQLHAIGERLSSDSARTSVQLADMSGRISLASTMIAHQAGQLEKHGQRINRLERSIKLKAHEDEEGEV